MRGGVLGLLITAIVLASCGLETVPSLNPPDVNYDATLLNGETSLSFVHSDSRYAGSDFVGYQIFYKIYPPSVGFSRLLSDRSSLSASPTIAQLTSLGYQSFTFSASNEGTSPGTEALLVQGLSDGDLVMLDFSDFLKPQAASTVQPLLKVHGSPAPKSFLYRTPVLVGTQNQTFGVLRTSTLAKNSSLPNAGLPVDLSSSILDSELATKAFEVNIFIAAYGMTTSLVEVSSSPVPWGVIRTIKP